ncbi:putative nf-x1 finger and helicase domain [Diaporthe ampelina]|uniref:Putative nf-x1 finger and helicase domain n=1 Tax=Diaporthe ampelina TaxID=1214573 RepID=A0A0G2HZ02_9PEZI|nr:putative nf-x1 finger and helicase domain [Diaporthe ampelina]
MSMHDHYEIDEDGNPTGIAAATKPFSMDEVKSCSVCRGSLRNICRYGRIVRRAMLDEATKKFISWSANRHLELAEGLIKEQKKLEQIVDGVQDVGRAGQLALTGDVFMQIRNLRKWVGQKRYNGLMQLYINIDKFSDQVSVQEQPFHRVFEFVRHARRQNKTDGAFHYDQDIVQLRGYLLALSLLLKCNIVILSDFMGLWKGSGIIQSKISVDFAANFNLCNKLIQLAVDTGRPQLQAEGHIYSAQFCGFAISLGLPGAPSKSADASIPGAFPDADTAITSDTEDEAATQREHLTDKGLDHVARARDLVGSASGESRHVMEAEIEAAETVLKGGVFYRPVTTDEMRAVYSAMAAEFLGTGHWYTCELGHPFTVGECGMPMEQARCPECGSPVGGQNHAPAEGVRRADVIEELARGVDGMRI